jgi:hypothetical protein
MIQFKRGSLAKWLLQKTPLADGQPAYDKTIKKLKIGDGKSLFKDLPYVSGLFANEILEAESAANDDTLFTYGTAVPSTSTKGKVYMQQFEGAVEADYVVEMGRSSNYFFRKWNSGFIECWGKGTVPTTISKLFTNIIYNTKTGEYFELKGFWK